MTRLLRKLLLCGAAVLAVHGSALAQGPAPDTKATPAADAPATPVSAASVSITPKTLGVPPGFVAPPEPKPDETNAERARSQPGNNAPIWRAARESGGDRGRQAGYASLPAVESGVLIQDMVQLPGMRATTAGEAWRQARNHWLVPILGTVFVAVIAVIALIFWKIGTMGGHSTDVGRKVERFTYYERTIHWTVAISFVVLELSGLIIAFGKFFLLPVLGGQLYGWLTYAVKNLHNFTGPVFAVALALFFVAYVRDNWIRFYDLKWLLYGIKGMLTGHEYPSHKFNMGEKAVFWFGATFLGLLVVLSGIVLDKLVPGMNYLRNDMQIAHLVHFIASMLMMTMFLIHMYLGTLGLDGAFNAMKTGWVDEAWAKEHHEYWYDDIKAGKIAAVRSGSKPADAAPAVATPPARA